MSHGGKKSAKILSRIIGMVLDKMKTIFNFGCLINYNSAVADFIRKEKLRPGKNLTLVFSCADEVQIYHFFF